MIVLCRIMTLSRNLRRTLACFIETRWRPYALLYLRPMFNRVRCPSSAGINTDALDSLRPVSVDEVMSIILKSCNLDPMPTRLLKQCLPVVVPAITSIINTTFDSGTVPSSLKLANIRPILKKPGLDKNATQNYRPISNLPFLSKVMEHAALLLLTDHLLDNAILDSHQSAYRANHIV